jgi:hypothetical protein
MMMPEAVLREGRVLIRTLGDTDLMKESTESQLVDPVVELKMSVFEFFKRNIESIDRRERLRSKIQDIIESRLDSSGDTMQLDELRSIYASISAEADRASEAIINLFKPVPGAPSLLVNNVGAPSGGENDMNAMYLNMSPADRDIIERFRQLMESSKQKKPDESATRSVN